MNKNNKNNFLKKQSNFLTTAIRFDISAIQQNIIYMGVIQFRDNDPEDKIYTIHVSELKKLTNRPVDYSHLKESSERLMEKSYNIYIDGSRLQLAPFASVKFKQGIIEFKVSPEIRPYFFGLKNNFTLFDVQMALKLKSKYAKWIYEMLCQFRSTGIFKISVQGLKERLGLVDLVTGKESYPHFADFDREVLKIAMEEINANTDITLKYRSLPSRTGRKIAKLEFYEVRSKEIAAPIQDLIEVSPLIRQLKASLNITWDLAKEVVKAFSGEKIEWVMNSILKENQAGKIRKLGAYSKTIFEEWLNGAVPTFEKTVTRIKHIPLKSSTQTDQIVSLEAKLQEKLFKELELEKSKVYGLIVKYGGDLATLEKLETAVIKVEKAIEKGEIEKAQEPILKLLNRELINQEIMQEAIRVAE